MTEIICLEKMGIYEFPANILDIFYDDKGTYFVFDKTIFYPQGGGQPADQGYILMGTERYDIYDVKNLQGKIRHYTNFDISSDRVLHSVKLFVNYERRILNAKYHTAGHLIAQLVENLIPLAFATKGHHFPGEAYIEFDKNFDFEDLKDKLNSELFDRLKKSLVVDIKKIDLIEAKSLFKDDRKFYEQFFKTGNGLMRVCCINGLPCVPCGGIHVKNLNQIGAVEIIKCKSKKGKIKISYKVT